jgi:hypothetical protein
VFEEIAAFFDKHLGKYIRRQLRHSCGGGLHVPRQNASYDVFESPAGTLKSVTLMPFTGSDATDFGGLLSIVNTKAVAATAKATLNSFNLRMIVAPGQRAAAAHLAGKSNTSADRKGMWQTTHPGDAVQSACHTLTAPARA